MTTCLSTPYATPALQGAPWRTFGGRGKPHPLANIGPETIKACNPHRTACWSTPYASRFVGCATAHLQCVQGAYAHWHRLGSDLQSGGERSESRHPAQQKHLIPDWRRRRRNSASARPRAPDRPCRRNSLHSPPPCVAYRALPTCGEQNSRRARHASTGISCPCWLETASTK